MTPLEAFRPTESLTWIERRILGLFALQVGERPRWRELESEIPRFLQQPAMDRLWDLGLIAYNRDSGYCLTEAGRKLLEVCA